MSVALGIHTVELAEMGPFVGRLWSPLQLTLEHGSDLHMESGGEGKTTPWEGGVMSITSSQRVGLKLAVVLPAAFL